MKPKLKPCNGQNCNGKLQPIWKREGKLLFCRSCWQQEKPSEPLKRTSIKPSQKPIPKQSSKRKKENAAYLVLRKLYLEQHPFCEIKVPGVCKGKSTQIHHTHSGGDREKYLNDTSTWLACDYDCHEYVHNHGEWSKEQGFLK